MPLDDATLPYGTTVRIPARGGPIIAVQVMMSEELLKTIILHLSPRHAYLLMQTNKHMYFAVFFYNYYWTRAAAHVVLRSHLVAPQHPWYSMEQPPGGYHRAMEGFAALVPAIVQMKPNVFRYYIQEEFTLLNICQIAVTHSVMDLEDEKKWTRFLGMYDEDVTAKDIMRAFARWWSPEIVYGARGGMYLNRAVDRGEESDSDFSTAGEGL